MSRNTEKKRLERSVTSTRTAETLPKSRFKGSRENPSLCYYSKLPIFPPPLYFVNKGEHMHRYIPPPPPLKKRPEKP